MSQRYRLSRLAIVLALVLTGCTSLQQDLEPPTVTVAGFRPVAGNGGALNFEIDLHIVNPNRQDLNIDGLVYTISLEGKKLVTGVGKDLPTIEGYSEADITVTATAGMLEVFQVLGGLMASPKDTVSYDLETKLDVGTFTPPIEVQKSGVITLQPPR